MVDVSFQVDTKWLGLFVALLYSFGGLIAAYFVGRKFAIEAGPFPGLPAMGAAFLLWLPAILLFALLTAAGLFVLVFLALFVLH